jgi:nucleotide-binding universal stress UspA family protein
MIAYDAVLVPLDGSEFAELALPVAAWLAAALDIEVHLFSAVATEDDVAERELELQKLDVPGRLVAHSVVVDLDPAGAIHEAVRRLRAVACMASHGRSRSAALIGSVATEVVARGHDPLVLVGPVVGDRPRGQGVVACVDDRREAATALAATTSQWAEALGEPAIVVTVAEPVPEPLRSGPVNRLFGPDGDVDAYLASVVRGLAVTTRAVYDPVGPVDGVISYVEEHPAAMLAVASHARTGAARFLLGSTAAAIVRRSPYPVLVVPRREDASG